MCEEESVVTPPLNGLAVIVWAKIEFAESTAFPLVWKSEVTTTLEVIST